MITPESEATGAPAGIGLLNGELDPYGRQHPGGGVCAVNDPNCCGHGATDVEADAVLAARASSSSASAAIRKLRPAFKLAPETTDVAFLAVRCEPDVSVSFIVWGYRRGSHREVISGLALDERPAAHGHRVQVPTQLPPADPGRLYEASR